MFDAIEEATQRGEEVIPTLVFGGIKVTMISTFLLYNVLVFQTFMVWFLFSVFAQSLQPVKLLSNVGFKVVCFFTTKNTKSTKLKGVVV